MGVQVKARVKVAFASGTAEQNRAGIDAFAASAPDVPLVVVAEFDPRRGQWIPFHVLRSIGANRASIQAALGDRQIAATVLVLPEGTEFAKLRAVAVSLVPRLLLDAPAWVLGSGLQKPLSRWARRVMHPGEAEIPVRARLAQAYGTVASRLRAGGREKPMGGVQPLVDGVTVVIPSRDGRELLTTLLPGLSDADEVIVIDNGSSDGTVEWLAAEYPKVQSIRTEAPLSFARAVNAGILKARFTHTLLLNNDMVVEPGFIQALRAPFGQIPDLFCSTAQIFFPSGVRREETGKAVWRQEQALDFPVRCDDPVAGEDLTPVLYGSGGCSLFDTAKLREMGGVSEVYDPAYVEDLDFGYRAWKRGWPSVFCADARVEHRHRATTARFFTARELDLFVERNYLRFLVHAVGSPALFRRLWREAIRRLQLLGFVEALRNVPQMGPRPPGATGAYSEPEILALGNGDVACFPGSATRTGRTVVIASPYIPFPLSHGGAVRMFNVMRQVAASYDLVLICFCDSPATPPSELLALCREVVLVRRHRSHYLVDTELPDMVQEFESECFRACLKYTLRRWNPVAVQLEFTWMAQYGVACAPVRTILVEHDITFELQEQLLTVVTEGRWELEPQAVKWRRFEESAWRRVDCVVTMSAKDTRAVAGARQVVCLPNGVDCGRFAPSELAPEPRRLLFIGSFAHRPNVLAFEYFYSSVWPLLEPGYRLHVITGQAEPPVPYAGVEFEGFVADVRPAYRRAEIVLAPLTASAGTNIKVLEAMAMGRVVVSTSAGINGLDLNPGVDVLVADDPAGMAEAIRSLTDERRIPIELAARATALRYDWNSIRYDRVYAPEHRD